jgi:hypothetical protein
MPVVTILFVPQSSTTCTKAMRISRGIKQAKAILSSMNNFSVRMYLPATLKRMMVAANAVHHQHTSNVGLSWMK